MIRVRQRRHIRNRSTKCLVYASFRFVGYKRRKRLRASRVIQVTGGSSELFCIRPESRVSLGPGEIVVLTGSWCVGSAAYLYSQSSSKLLSGAAKEMVAPIISSLAVVTSNLEVFHVADYA